MIYTQFRLTSEERDELILSLGYAAGVCMRLAARCPNRKPESVKCQCAGCQDLGDMLHRMISASRSLHVKMLEEEKP